MSRQCKTQKEWEAIKTEYISSRSTYAELSKKHDVSVSALRYHAVNENWKEERLRYKNDQKKHSKVYAVECSREGREQIMAMSEYFISIMQVVLDDEQQLYRPVEKVKKSHGHGPDRKELDIHALRNLVSALKDIVYIIQSDSRVSYTQNERVRRITLEGALPTAVKTALNNFLQACKTNMHEI